jgi:hypothetical protein
VTTFSAPPPIIKVHQRGVRKGRAPFWLGVWSGAVAPLIAKTMLDLGEAKNGLDLKVTCDKRWKVFYSILIQWEVAALWNQFWWGETTQNSDFWHFWHFPLCHGNKKIKIEHAVTKAMVQSTSVPSLISIESFLIDSYQCELAINGNSHFSQYARAVEG